MSGCLGALFGRLGRPQLLKVPVLGVGASGKTTFAWGLGRTLVDREWGHSADESAGYFLKIDAALLNNRNPEATSGQTPLVFLCEKCAFADGTPELSRIVSLLGSRDGGGAAGSDPPVRYAGDLGEYDSFTWSFRRPMRISTYDMSGSQFENCMRVFDTASANPESDPEVRRFMDIVRGSDGLIVIVDLARRITSRQAFTALRAEERERHLLGALAEQVMPLCRGVARALAANPNMAGKPIIFAYTKHDIHCLSDEQVRRMLETAYAPLFASLRRRNVLVEHCCLAYEGVHRDESTGEVRFGVRGTNELLAKLVVGLLESRSGH